ncbi:MAG: FAD-dependent oxidoreductase, partial [Planctomycetota bacterium]|nr:FAD-dependent oxidoreductase [Planctomycetota bacterium]
MPVGDATEPEPHDRGRTPAHRGDPAMSATPTERADAVVVGGGLFGAWLALLLAREHRLSVVLLEREPALLRRASYNNQ